MLFQTTKIQTFESNSQPPKQRFFYRAQLFQTTKIQTFESNSQLDMKIYLSGRSCFRLQRYKLLKAIHNYPLDGASGIGVVSDYKDTNF